MAESNLEKDFRASVMDDIKILKEKYGYNPKFFLDMIIDHDIVDTAKRLIHSSEPSDGYTQLWHLKALQYSIENQIQDERWKPLFTDKDRAKAKKRLADYGFRVNEE